MSYQDSYPSTRPSIRAAFVFISLAAFTMLGLACSPSATTPDQTQAADIAESQPASVVGEPAPSPVVSSPDTGSVEPSPVAPSPATPSSKPPTAEPSPIPDGPAPMADLGKYALIPENERRLPPDFELTTVADEPFSVVDRSGEVVILYQTEF